MDTTEEKKDVVEQGPQEEAPTSPETPETPDVSPDESAVVDPLGQETASDGASQEANDQEKPAKADDYVPETPAADVVEESTTPKTSGSVLVSVREELAEFTVKLRETVGKVGGDVARGHGERAVSSLEDAVNALDAGIESDA